MRPIIVNISSKASSKEQTCPYYNTLYYYSHLLLNKNPFSRWYGLAVPWPRILALPDKSPGSKRLSRTAGIQAAKLLRLRASLATYQHTVLSSHVKKDAPIFATASVYYPDEERPGNVSISSQFMWGDSILVGEYIHSQKISVTFIDNLCVWYYVSLTKGRLCQSELCQRLNLQLTNYKLFLVSKLLVWI